MHSSLTAPLQVASHCTMSSSLRSHSGIGGWRHFGSAAHEGRPRRHARDVRQQLGSDHHLQCARPLSRRRRATAGFELFHQPDPFGRDLAYLAGLVAAGVLDPQLADELPWTEMPTALRRLGNREVSGKLALIVK